jgi:hypothetical protein
MSGQTPQADRACMRGKTAARELHEAFRKSRRVNRSHHEKLRRNTAEFYYSTNV